MLYSDDPDPVLRCDEPGCGWELEAHPDDWNDHGASMWYRADQHVMETHHSVSLYLNRESTNPEATIYYGGGNT